MAFIVTDSGGVLWPKCSPVKGSANTAGLTVEGNEVGANYSTTKYKGYFTAQTVVHSNLNTLTSQHVQIRRLEASYSKDLSSLVELRLLLFCK